MKIIKGENETVIYPMLAQNDTEFDDDFCIVVGNSCTMINNRIVDEDDLPKIIEGLEKALEITDIKKNKKRTYLEAFAELRKIVGDAYDEIDDVVGYVNALRADSTSIGITNKQMVSLKALLDYVEEEEEEHFEETPLEEREKHIYNDIMVLRKFVEEIEGKKS